MDLGLKLALSQIVQALQMAALLLDADGAGYLEIRESLSVQKLKVDFSAICQSIALKLLRTHTDIHVASTAFKNELTRMRSSIQQAGYEQDDAILFPFLEDHVLQALEIEGQKTEIARNFSRFIFLIPNLFRWIFIALLAVVLVWAFVDFFYFKRPIG